MSFLNLNYLLKGPVSKYSSILHKGIILKCRCIHSCFLKVQFIDQGKSVQVDPVSSVPGFSNCVVIYCLQLTLLKTYCLVGILVQNNPLFLFVSEWGNSSSDISHTIPVATLVLLPAPGVLQSE